MPFPHFPTPHQCLRLAQILFCNAAAFSTAALSRTTSDGRGWRRLVPPSILFVAAFVTRMILQETESRLQIAVFALATLFVEWLRARNHRRRPDGLQWALNAIAAAFGVLLAKHILEPGAIGAFVIRVLSHVIDLQAT